MTDSYFEAMIILRDAYLKAYTLTKSSAFEFEANLLDARVRRERARRISNTRRLVKK